jgi:hypothetical protein
MEKIDCVFFMTLNWGIFGVKCVIGRTIYDIKTSKNGYYVEIKYVPNIFPLIFCDKKNLDKNFPSVNLDFSGKKSLNFFYVR